MRTCVLHFTSNCRRDESTFEPSCEGEKAGLDDWIQVSYLPGALGTGLSLFWVQKHHASSPLLLLLDLEVKLNVLLEMTCVYNKGRVFAAGPAGVVPGALGNRVGQSLG